MGERAQGGQQSQWWGALGWAWLIKLFVKTNNFINKNFYQNNCNL